MPIIGCLLIITVINLSFTTSEDSLEPLDAPLADVNGTCGVSGQWRPCLLAGHGIIQSADIHYRRRSLRIQDSDSREEWPLSRNPITLIAAPRPQDSLCKAR